MAASVPRTSSIYLSILTDLQQVTLTCDKQTHRHWAIACTTLVWHCGDKKSFKIYPLQSVLKAHTDDAHITSLLKQHSEFY